MCVCVSVSMQNWSCWLTASLGVFKSSFPHAFTCVSIASNIYYDARVVKECPELRFSVDDSDLDLNWNGNQICTVSVGDLHTNHVCVCFFFNFWGGGLNELLVKRQLMTAVGQIGRSSRSRSNDWWLNDNFLIKAWELNKFIKFTMARTTRDLRYVRLFGHKDLHMNAQKSFINLSSCSRSSSSLLFCFGFVFYLRCRPIKVRFIRNGW